MTSVTFDTHAFVKRRTSAGMPEAQAESLAEEQSRLIDDKLAAKVDLANLERAVRTDLEVLEQRLTIKFGCVAVISVGVILVAL